MITFRVPDMTCGHCASIIARAVAGVDKAARIEVNVPVKLVSVTSTAAEGELMEAIQEAGYPPQKVAPARPTPRTSGCCCASRKSALVDPSQGTAPASSACCG